jgi:hypothetical protein
MRAGGWDSMPGSADKADLAEGTVPAATFSIAYRMTGSAGDADDIAQDVFPASPGLPGGGLGHRPEDVAPGP